MECIKKKSCPSIFKRKPTWFSSKAIKEIPSWVSASIFRMAVSVSSGNLFNLSTATDHLGLFQWCFLCQTVAVQPQTHISQRRRDKVPAGDFAFLRNCRMAAKTPLGTVPMRYRSIYQMVVKRSFHLINRNFLPVNFLNQLILDLYDVRFFGIVTGHRNRHFLERKQNSVHWDIFLGLQNLIWAFGTLLWLLR